MGVAPSEASKGLCPFRIVYVRLMKLRSIITKPAKFLNWSDFLERSEFQSDKAVASRDRQGSFQCTSEDG